ncbi:CC153 protein, partial [Trogon melanurus]|nr:CC153 protein [Trogon melanurus]
WRDMSWQTKAGNEGLQQRLWNLERALEQAWEDRSMIWQYQELQKQTAAHSRCLEVKILQEQLAARLQESQQTQETATQPPAERDRTIAQLQCGLYTVGCSLDLVLAQLAETSQYWEEVRTTFAMEHKERLQEFSLNPLDI